MNQLCNPWEHDLSRRKFLGGAASAFGVGAFGGLVSPSAAEQIKRKEKQVLFVWLDGGISQLESWDPKPNTRFGGPFRSLKTTLPGVHVSELMPHTAKIMHKLCVVRSMSTKDNSHSAGVGRIQRGDPVDRGVTYPYFGSAVSKLMGPTSTKLPPYVWVKPGSGGFKAEDAGFLGPKYGALAFGDGQPPPNLLRHEDITEEEDAERNELRELLNRRYASQRRKRFTEASSHVFDTAHALMKRSDIFDTSTLSEKEIDRYGRNDLGHHMLVGRRMLEAGVRFVKVNSYGWDTHGDHFNGSVSLIGKFDRAFAAIVNDLDDRGMLDHVLVIALSEFGRTPRINGHVGRDHWPEAWSIAMAGTGIQRGTVIGSTNSEGTFVASKAFDIGHMFHTWFRALGIDSTREEYINNGQPLPLAHDDMDVIEEALA